MEMVLPSTRPIQLTAPLAVTGRLRHVSIVAVKNFSQDIYSLDI